MYSLTIHFGPNAMVWQFLFKDKDKAELAFKGVDNAICEQQFFRVGDDFGQTAIFGQGDAKGCLLEDLDLIERARIERALAEERCKVKLMTAAKSDPTIAAAIRAQQNGPGVLTPFRQ